MAPPPEGPLLRIAALGPTDATRARRINNLYTFTDGCRRLRPQALAAGLVEIDDPSEADVLAVVHDWTALTAAERTDIEVTIDALRPRPCVVWVNGDRELDLRGDTIVQVQACGRRSVDHRVRDYLVFPTFLGDELATHFGGELTLRPWTPEPSVGFCGQGGRTPRAEAGLAARKVLQRVRRVMRRDAVLPEPLTSHLALRHRALDRLAATPGIRTDFVVHDRYRAGVTDSAALADPLHDSKRRFFENVRGTDYTVCVRGGGNFSNRLYEVLCMGRIPIIVDSDMRLPYEDRTDWRSVGAWVPADDVDDIGRRLLEFHRALSADDFAALQQRSRSWWLEWANHEAFLGYLVGRLRETPSLA